MISLRQYTGKQLVSFLRKADFAHAGEEEAIELLMSFFEKKSGQSILDVGCGLGGSAQYIQQQGWGKVSGFDIEKESIDYAREKYQEIKFYVCDVLDSYSKIDEQFDIICLLNSWYAFKNQTSALKVLNQLTKAKGKMAIFDYSDPCQDRITPLFRSGDQYTTAFIPIDLKTIDGLLAETGWRKIDYIDISECYIQWYENLILELITNKERVVVQFGAPAFEKAFSTYSKIKNSIAAQLLGGAIIYAEKINA